MAKPPFEGIRVLDMTMVWAGPYGTMFLADMGAEVVRVESIKVWPTTTRGFLARPPKQMEATAAPGGAMYPMRTPGERAWNRYSFFNAHARNKYSMTVNLNTPEGKDVFRRLVEVSDGLVENNVTGSMARLGLTYDVLSQWNPRFIMVSASGMGQTGPWAHYRGWGNHFEAIYGHASLMGYPDMGPEATPSNVSADAATGVAIALAFAMALHNRNRTGRGQYIDLSQGENYIPHLGEIFLDYTMNGRVAGKLGNRRPGLVQGCYPCMGSDEWITFTIETDEQWASLCRLMGRPELAEDERFADAISRYRHHDEIDEIIKAWTREQENMLLFHRLQKAGIPSGPIQHEDEAYRCPHLAARGFFVPITQEDTGTYLYPSTTFKMSETPFVVRKPPVRLGEDNEYIYKEVLKVSDEEYAELEARGHIGMDYAPEVP